METAYNEPIAAIIIGLLLSVSAGFRVMLPLLAVNLLATYHLITLPLNLAWLGAHSTLLLLSVAAVAETVIHFIPAAGTALKAMATPLAFVAGTLLMAVPLGDKNPLYQWTLAAVFGGGLATLTHLGVTGARALAEPANIPTLGMSGLVWNVGEFLLSLFLSVIGTLCLFVGWLVGAVLLMALLTLVLIAVVRGMTRGARTQPVVS